MNKREFEIYLAVNDDGDAAVSLEDGSTARETLIDDYGGAAIRTVKLSVTMAIPEIEELDVEVADTAGTTEPVGAEAA
jgi:hypothetical protein